MGNLSKFGEGFELRAPEYDDFSPITPGEYQMGIVNTELKKIDDQKVALNIQLQITSPGDMNGRTFRDSIWMYHGTSELAHKIGREKLSALIYSCGFDKLPEDTDLFVGRTCEGYVGFQKDRDTKQPTQYSEVKRYIFTPPGEAQAPSPQVPDTTAAFGAPAAPGEMSTPDSELPF